MNDSIKTIRDAVEAFRHFFEDVSGRPSSSMAYPPKLIYYFLKMYKNKVSYEDKYIKSKTSSGINVELTIPCVELIKVDQVECPCAPASGCQFFKSKHPLPKMMNGMLNAVTLIKQHSSQKNYGIFTFVDWYSFEDKINSRIKAQAYQPYFTLKNINSKIHLYVYANTGEYENLKAVSIVGIFADILDVLSFPTCGQTTNIVCNPLDEEFMIEDEIQSKVFELTYRALLGFKGASRGTDNSTN